MKKSGSFALAVILLVIGVAAVMSVNYPPWQQTFVDFISGAGARIGYFVGLFIEPFRAAFIKG